MFFVSFTQRRAKAVRVKGGMPYAGPVQVPAAGIAERGMENAVLFLEAITAGMPGLQAGANINAHNHVVYQGLINPVVFISAPSPEDNVSCGQHILWDIRFALFCVFQLLPRALANFAQIRCCDNFLYHD